VGTLLVVTVAGSLLWLFTGEPYYRGRPVSQWPVDYSQKLYPIGTAPLSASQRGLDALRDMGPQKAATALVYALMRGDSKLYEQYRSLYARFPAWYQNRFPLRLTHQQKVTLILGATEFFDPDYQKAIISFLIPYLEKPDTLAQVAACELLASMPEAASPALPALKHLTSSAEPAVSQEAQTAIDRIMGRRGNQSDRSLQETP
jgi:hypothetical protein